MNLKLHSAQEVADLIGIKLDTLYRYVRSGQIRGMKIGKSWKFAETDLQEFIQRHRTGVPSAPSKTLLLQDILTDAAITGGDDAGITFQGAKVPYSEILTRSSRLADSLLSEGLVPGDRVLLLLPNSIEFIVGCFAVWKAGGILFRKIRPSRVTI